MSDITLKWSVLDYIMIALFLCGPGAVVGLVVGAAGWRGHRILGGVLGAIEGFVLLFCYLHIYIESSLSVSDGAAEAALKALAVTWPGVAIAGAAAAYAWRGHRILGAMAGAPVGFVLWLYGWWLLA
jgi:hypothetical protein